VLTPSGLRRSRRSEALATEQDVNVRKRLREMLVGFGARGRDAVQQLMNAASWEVRRTAAYLLREFGGTEALADLEPLLNDSEPLVQKEAVEAIALNGNESPTEWSCASSPVGSRARQPEKELRRCGRARRSAVPLPRQARRSYARASRDEASTFRWACPAASRLSRRSRLHQGDLAPFHQAPAEDPAALRGIGTAEAREAPAWPSGAARRARRRQGAAVGMTEDRPGRNLRAARSCSKSSSGDRPAVRSGNRPRATIRSSRATPRRGVARRCIEFLQIAVGFVGKDVVVADTPLPLGGSRRWAS
jgi:hypothetical protein